MLGKYFHAITSHAAIQYRFISGRASNTEQEESVFQFLKKVSNNTSNHFPDRVILNSLIRLQVTDNIRNESNHVDTTEKEISKMFEREISYKKCTIFTFDWI